MLARYFFYALIFFLGIINFAMGLEFRSWIIRFLISLLELGELDLARIVRNRLYTYRG